MIGTILNQIIERVKSVNSKDVLGYELKIIQDYNGELKNYNMRCQLKDYPAVWIAFDGSPPPIQETNNYIKRNYNYVILVATNNKRNEHASRHGVVSDNGEIIHDVGAYQILMDMDRLFSGHVLHEKADRSSTGSISEVVVDTREDESTLCVLALKITVPVRVEKFAPVVSTDEPLSAIHTDWDLPPFNPDITTLPDEENADASSLVEGD